MGVRGDDVDERKGDRDWSKQGSGAGFHRCIHRSLLCERGVVDGPTVRRQRAFSLEV